MVNCRSGDAFRIICECGSDIRWHWTHRSANIVGLEIGTTTYDVTFNLVSTAAVNGTGADITGNDIFDDGDNTNSTLPIFPFDYAGSILARDAIIAFLDGNVSGSCAGCPLGEENLTHDGDGNRESLIIPYQVKVNVDPFFNLITTQYDSVVGRQNHLQDWQIRPNASFRNLQSHSLVWTTFNTSAAVPEPSVILLFGLGLLGLGFIRRKREQ